MSLKILKAITRILSVIVEVIKLARNRSAKKAPTSTQLKDKFDTIDKQLNYEYRGKDAKAIISTAIDEHNSKPDR